MPSELSYVPLNATRASKACLVATLCLSTSLLTSLPLNASPNQQLLDLSLEDLLNITISSSTLTNENLRTAPSAITLYTHEQIQQLGVDYLHELLNLVPGFQSFRQEESADEYYHSVRGHRSSTSSREVLILIDGQRFNREFDNAINVPMISLVNIEKIEFIRGPGSAIYGSNAFSGVISISTKKNHNAVNLQIGDDQHRRASLQASHSLNGSETNIYIGAYNDNEGHQYLLQDYGDGQLYPAGEYRSGLDFSLNTSLEKLELSATHLRRKSEGFYTLLTLSEENLTENSFSSVRASFSPTIGKFENALSIRAYRSRYFSFVDDPFFGDTQFEQLERGTELKLQSQGQISDQNNLSFGAEYRKVNIDEVIYRSEFYGDDRLYDEEERTVLGAYVQSQNQLSSRTRITAGVRVDAYSGINEALSPRLGLIHELNAHNTLKLLYGEAFRAPTTNEMKILNVYGLVNFEGNSNLKPERIKTWELVWMGNWASSSYSATYFHQTINDAIFRESRIELDTFGNEQGEEFSQGVELEYTLDLNSQLRVRGHYSVFDNLSDKDFQQAENLAALSLNYHQAQWNFNLSGAYSGEREFMAIDERQALPDYWEINSKINYRINDALQFNVQIKNLLDDNYKTPVRRSDLSYPIPNRGREVSLALQFQF